MFAGTQWQTAGQSRACLWSTTSKKAAPCVATTWVSAQCVQQYLQMCEPKVLPDAGEGKSTIEMSCRQGSCAQQLVFTFPLAARCATWEASGTHQCRMHANHHPARYSGGCMGQVKDTA